MRTLRAQTGRPKRTALGIHTGLERCAPCLLRSSMPPNKRFLLRPGPRRQNRTNRKFAVPGDRPASRVAFCASALGSRSGRQEKRARGECVRAAACAGQQGYAAPWGSGGLTNVDATRFF